MYNEISGNPSNEYKFLDELLEQLSNPIHKRIIQAYLSDNTVESMEYELGNILSEVLLRAD